MKYTVAVRTLCEFTAKLGDLDLRFTPSATALEGMAGHAMVAARRGESYQSEVWLQGEYGDLLVRGRADGFDPDAGRLDEVKTFRGDLAAMPANRRSLHWAQAKVYGALLCREFGLTALTVSLVYFDVDEQREAAPGAKARGGGRARVGGLNGHGVASLFAATPIDAAPGRP